MRKARWIFFILCFSAPSYSAPTEPLVLNFDLLLDRSGTQKVSVLMISHLDPDELRYSYNHFNPDTVLDNTGHGPIDKNAILQEKRKETQEILQIVYDFCMDVEVEELKKRGAVLTPELHAYLDDIRLGKRRLAVVTRHGHPKEVLQVLAVHPKRPNESLPWVNRLKGRVKDFPEVPPLTPSIGTSKIRFSSKFRPFLDSRILSEIYSARSWAKGGEVEITSFVKSPTQRVSWWGPATLKLMGAFHYLHFDETPVPDELKINGGNRKVWKIFQQNKRMFRSSECLREAKAMEFMESDFFSKNYQKTLLVDRVFIECVGDKFRSFYQGGLKLAPPFFHALDPDFPGTGENAYIFLVPRERFEFESVDVATLLFGLPILDSEGGHLEHSILPSAFHERTKTCAGVLILPWLDVQPL